MQVDVQALCFKTKLYNLIYRLINCTFIKHIQGFKGVDDLNDFQKCNIESIILLWIKSVNNTSGLEVNKNLNLTA